MRRDEDSQDVYLLRRIHRDHFKSGQPLEVAPTAFRPSKSDTDGLSVSFEAEISALDLAELARQGAENYGVVRLSLSEIEKLQLTVIRDDSEDADAGDALIPEINANAYYRSTRESKRRLKELGLELARLANDNIVLRPDAE